MTRTNPWSTGKEPCSLAESRVGRRLVEESMRYAVRVRSDEPLAKGRGALGWGKRSGVTLALLALLSSMALMSFGCSSSSAPPAVSFTNVYTEIIQQKCSNDYCHAAGASQKTGGDALDMSSQVVAYWSLVDQFCAGPPCLGSGYRRVAPGDPSSSMLYLKVSESNPGCGNQMPADLSYFLVNPGESRFSGTALSDPDQTLIYNWIKEGAQNN